MMPPAMYHNSLANASIVRTWPLANARAALQLQWHHSEPVCEIMRNESRHHSDHTTGEHCRSDFGTGQNLGRDKQKDVCEHEPGSCSENARSNHDRTVNEETQILDLQTSQGAKDWSR